MRELVATTADGLFRLDLDYFTHHATGVAMTWESGSPEVGRVFSDRLEQAARAGARAGRASSTTLHHDVAAALQAPARGGRAPPRRLASRRAAGARNLCLAGGVALNAVANGRIRPETAFEELYVQPAAGDSGTAVGAAFHVWNAAARRAARLRHAPRLHRARLRRAGDRRRRSRPPASTASGSTTTRSSRRSPRRSRPATSSAGSRDGWSSGRARSATARSSPTRAAPR